MDNGFVTLPIEKYEEMKAEIKKHKELAESLENKLKFQEDKVKESVIVYTSQNPELEEDFTISIDKYTLLDMLNLSSIFRDLEHTYNSVGRDPKIKVNLIDLTK